MVYVLDYDYAVTTAYGFKKPTEHHVVSFEHLEDLLKECRRIKSVKDFTGDSLYTEIKAYKVKLTDEIDLEDLLL